MGSGLTSPPSSAPRVNNYIGKSNWASNPPFGGCMDNVRIYNIILSPTEIQELAADFPVVTEVWVDNDYAPGEYNDGHIWAIDAFFDIRDGLNAVDYGDTVHVNAGTYYIDSGSIELKNGVKLIGEQPETTIIDGTPDQWHFQRYSVITSEKCDPNTLFEGFTVKNAGNRYWQQHVGGALYNSMSDLVVRNCIFKNNMADAGSAIYNDRT